MPITLGGITLPDMIWSDRYESQQVAQTIKRTLGGKPVIFVGALIAGRSITLEATTNFAWLTRDQVAAVQALADVADGVYDLIYNAVTYSVMFRHADAPAVSFTPNLARVAQFAADNFTGTIKLITV